MGTDRAGWRMRDMISRMAHSSPVQRLRAILLYADLEFSELMTSIAALAWGLWLLMPWVYLASPSRPVMLALLEIAPEGVWALLAIALGALQGLALAKNLTMLRSWVSAAAFFLWFSISLLFGMLDSGNPHAPLYAILALGAGWAHLRAAVIRVHAPRYRAAARCSDL